jgi:FlaA1/EpsC-like NDP-sugar epimerase
LNDLTIKRNIKDKVILVAGGAGSIGSVLIERLVGLSPKKIIIIDKDEFSIFNLKKKFKESKHLIYKLSDASNKFFLEKIFNKFKPDIIYNAAAYKHVSIVEENTDYAMFNNLNF